MTKTTDNLSFEDAIEALDGIVHQLENDELPLASALEVFERSQSLLQLCQQQLTQAQAKVQVLVKQMESTSFELEEFEQD